MKLIEYQQALSRAVRFRETPKPLAEGVLGAGDLTGEAAVDVYRTMYWYRLVDALFDLLPRTSHLLGKRVFTERVCAALAAEPSPFFAIERLATPVAAFLAAHSETPKLAADVARIEATFVDALLSPNASEPLLSSADVAHPSFATHMATLHPSVRLVSVSPEALAIYRDAPKEPDVEGPALSGPPSPPVDVVLSRPSMTVLSLEIDRAERELLSSRRFAIVDLVQTLAGHDGSPDRAFSRLSTWLSHGLLLHPEHST